jgi:hypothetical protein
MDRTSNVTDVADGMVPTGKERAWLAQSPPSIRGMLERSVPPGPMVSDDIEAVLSFS